jgi:aminoglycoside phosphotransferase (APT) family kinase protein
VSSDESAQEAPKVRRPPTEERLPLDRLLPWLRPRLSRVLGRPLPGKAAARQFTGGHANLTYLLSLGIERFVLRRPPLGPLPAGAHDMPREHRVLAGLAAAFPLAPRAYLLCEDPGVIGAPFLVMEYREGSVVQQVLPAQVSESPERCERLGRMLVEVLARLHGVDPESAGLGDLGHPEGYTRRQLDGWTRRWERAGGAESGAARDMLDWLSSHCPPDGPTSLLHNDFKLNNLIVDSDDATRPVALIDWDMCTRGTGLFDLGHMLNYWVEAGDPPEWREAASMPTWHEGFPRREEAIELYARLTGYGVQHVAWYQVFGAFKLMGILQQIYTRFEAGQTRDPRFAAFGRRIAILQDKALSLIARA